MAPLWKERREICLVRLGRAYRPACMALRVWNIAALGHACR